MSNVIPRKAKKIDVEFLIDTSAHSRYMKAEKSDTDGWIGKSESGEKFSLPISMLRNSDVCILRNVR